MNLNGTQTLQNLARAFAGESQARNRYLFYAEKAREEGFFYIADRMQEIIRNEMAHAQVFFDLITANMPGPVDNIDIHAGYPFKKGNTLDNLRFAYEAEEDENTTIYPQFAQVAKDEGIAEAARAFENIAQIEGNHHKFFRELHLQVKEGSLYQKQAPVVWKCSFCGHTHEALRPWETCPVCHKPKGYVEAIFNVR